MPKHFNAGPGKPVRVPELIKEDVEAIVRLIDEHRSPKEAAELIRTILETL